MNSFKTLLFFFIVVSMTLIFFGCVKNDDEANSPTPQGSRYTHKIENTPVYLNLENGDTASLWDIAYVQGVVGTYPKFLLNGGHSGSKGWWGAQVSTSFDHTNDIPDTNLWRQDVNDSVLAIGGRGTWARYDFTTHNFIGRDTVTFILRYDAYRWVKIQPTIAYSLDSAVVFRFAFSDSVKWENRTIYWGATQLDSIQHAIPRTPYGYRFGIGQVQNRDWHFAMTTVWYPTPALHGSVKFPYGRLNKKAGMFCAWIDQPYENVATVPSGVNWITDGDSLATGWIFNYPFAPPHRLLPWNKTLLLKDNNSGHFWKISFDDYYNLSNQNEWGYVSYRFARL